MSRPTAAGLPGRAIESPAPSAHPMPAGRMGPRIAVLSLAIGIAAVNTGNNLLYLMLSLSLALATISTAASRRALRTIRVATHLPEEVRSGEPFEDWDFNDLVVEITAIPEPASLATFGLLALIGMRRRRA